jgi:putative ATPase
MRPQTLSEYIGQTHILSPDKLLYKSINSGNIFSMILWGPPGVGKTTLARVIANTIDANFLEFSAVTASIVELKKIFQELQNPQQSLEQKMTVVFIDEIHRFNKAQQDALLPFVENGTITLIGATTENPSFEVIGPLLSRTRVFTLQQLTEEDLETIVKSALKDNKKGLGDLNLKIKKDALQTLIEGSNGDGRSLLNILEIAATIASTDKSKEITKEQVVEAMQTRMLNYDKGGEEHYNTISAFIKSMRASNPDAALYYLARMVNAGEDPLFIARRMVIFASEDIGMAQPTALVVANEVFKSCETIGYPECQINLAHGVVYLSLAKKDRSAYEGYFKALEDVKMSGNIPIPMSLRNAPTKLMQKEGYGKGYEMYTEKDLLPEKLKGKKYFKKIDFNNS